jgi:hypothetical protein
MTGDSNSDDDRGQAWPPAAFWNFLRATLLVIILAWLFARDVGISLW